MLHGAEFGSLFLDPYFSSPTSSNRNHRKENIFSQLSSDYQGLSYVRSSKRSTLSVPNRSALPPYCFGTLTMVGVKYFPFISLKVLVIPP